MFLLDDSVDWRTTTKLRTNAELSNLLRLQRERLSAAVNLVHLCRQNLAASLPNKSHRQPNIVVVNAVARLCRVVELLRGAAARQIAFCSERIDN